MRLRHLLLPLLALPLLSACVNDGATYEIDNTREHVLSLIRQVRGGALYQAEFGKGPLKVFLWSHFAFAARES